MIAVIYYFVLFALGHFEVALGSVKNNGFPSSAADLSDEEGLGTSSVSGDVGNQVFISEEEHRWLENADVEELQVFELLLEIYVSTDQLRGQLGNKTFREYLSNFLHYRYLRYSKEHGAVLDDWCSVNFRLAMIPESLSSDNIVASVLAECLELEAGNMGRNIWIPSFKNGFPGQDFLDTWKLLSDSLKENSLSDLLRTSMGQMRFFLFYRKLGAELRKRQILIESVPDKELILMAENGTLTKHLRVRHRREQLMAEMVDTVLLDEPEVVFSGRGRQPIVQPFVSSSSVPHYSMVCGVMLASCVAVILW